MSRQTGVYQSTSTAGEVVRAFVPHPLPPADPPLQLSDEVDHQLAQAMTALSRLEVAGNLVPSTDWFLYGFVRKEAVLTSQIEGTQATLRDVLAFEATETTDRPDDVEEVCNYVNALTYSRRQLARSNGLPLSTRLLCQAHKRLMSGARGHTRRPGALRTSQNWIGGTRPGNARFVPPPPESVPSAMADLEKWLHCGDTLPPLIKAGLAHVQFETIHPFLDGNGRIGRLLITLLLEHWQVQKTPLLYLSLALKRQQQEYYARLAAVRTEGDWEGWTIFFLECVRAAADDGVRVAQELHALMGRDRARIMNHQRSTVAAIQLLESLPANPVITVQRATKLLGITPPTARKAIELLDTLNVLRETTGKHRDRVYAYHNYMRILTSGDA